MDYDSTKRLEDYDLDEISDEDDGIKRFAIKRIFPTINAPYILIEMLILKLIKGNKYITNLVSGYRKESQVSLVFEYQRSQSFLVFVEEISRDDVRQYLFQLLSAVKHLADKGIVHRDIKPSNFLWDPRSSKGILIDFGLSEVETDENSNPLKNRDDEIIQQIVELQKKMGIKNRTGTKGYMPPESIFNSPNQGPAVDIWAVGVIMLSFLMKRHPIISLNNTSKVKNFTIANLLPLTIIFGSNEIKNIAHEYGYGIIVPEDIPKKRMPWNELV
jgi:cell division control protein 7